MYVCICNALRDRDLAQAASHPDATSAAKVFQRCAARPKCGRCIPDVTEIISSVQISRDDTLNDAAE